MSGESNNKSADIKSLRKLFAANIGRRARIDVADGEKSRILRGEVYCVGNAFLSLIDDESVSVAELAEIYDFAFE
ncbi:MAG: hypothetical protein J1G38_01605 [Clostridiales bacterium]|nr:hypothetical protein [Clostridiales bacterium]